MKQIIINPAWRPHAKEFIEKSKAYKGDLSFFLAMRISGERNACLRQAVMLELTGKTLPKSKCGINAVYLSMQQSD